ncbi:hypothetical protein [Arsenicitalea aurantiaca]|uniref:hypothetical protein n=1 Tax=Arsenicitalea aurantiaca TaxID=1783274 RepID=UPI001FCE5DD5|nr:hypothetical protein [Arsenicitalea aurantiaca]
MPTLIRLIVFLAILAGLAFGAMVALSIFVDPGEREVTVRIPARELQNNVQSTEPLGPRGLPPPSGLTPPPPANPAPSAPEVTQ